MLNNECVRKRQNTTSRGIQPGREKENRRKKHTRLFIFAPSSMYFYAPPFPLPFIPRDPMPERLFPFLVLFLLLIVSPAQAQRTVTLNLPGSRLP